MADRSAYQSDLLSAMAGSQASARARSPVRPLEASRAFSQAYARQRERRIARELRNIARVTGNTEGYRSAGRAERDIAIAGRSRDASALSTATPAGPPRVWVEGFRKKDGTFIPGHWRTNPNPAQAEPTPLVRAAESVLSGFGPSSYTPLGPAVNVDGGWFWRNDKGELVAAGPGDVLDRRNMRIMARNERRPFPEAHERSQGVGLAGKVLGLMGLDSSGERARTSWGEAWENTQAMSLLNMAQGGFIAAERGLRERRGPELDTESAALAMEAAGTLVATAAPGVAMAGPSGAIGAAGGKGPRGARPKLKQATDLNELGLYSRLSRAIDRLDPSGTPRDMLNRLDRILGPESVAAREEMHLTGVRQMLEERAAGAARPGSNVPNRITRDEIRQHFEANRIEIVQNVLGGPGNPPALYSTYALNPGSWSRYRERLFQWMRPGERASLMRLDELRDRRDAAYQDRDTFHGPDPSAVRRNAAEAAAAYQEAETEHLRRYPPLPRSHWRHYRGLAGGHLRTSTETVRMPDGRNLRSRLIEESQNDWAQRNRNIAVRAEQLARIEADTARLNAEYVSLFDEGARLLGLPRGLSEREVRSRVNEFFDRRRYEWQDGIVREGEEPIADLWRRMRETLNTLDLRHEERDIISEQPLPVPGPFVGNTSHWVDFQLATQLMDAAENRRLQALAIISGEEVARRFGQSWSLEYDPHRGVLVPEVGPMIPVHGPGLSTADRMAALETKVREVIDRHPRFNLSAQERERLFSEARQNRRVVLNVPNESGRGNVEFYNNIVRRRLERLVRSVDPDARVQIGIVRARNPDGSTRQVPVSVVEMTRQLRARLLAGGLPMMANPAVAAVPAAITSQAADRRRRFDEMLARARGRYSNGRTN